MKKIFHNITAAILILGSVSCSKQNAAPDGSAVPDVEGQIAIVANIADEAITRASLDGNDTDGYKVLWNEGDKIELFLYTESGSEIVTYTLSKGAGTTSGVFCGAALSDGEYTVGYGDNLSMTNGGILYTTQNYSSSQNACCAPMMAKVTVTNGVASIADFTNICGLLRLELKGTATIKEIAVTTTQPQAGLISLDDDGAAHIRIYPGAKTVTLDCGESGVELTPEAKPFIISMPKNDYTGVKIEITDMAGNVCTKTLVEGKALSIKRAMITPIAMTVAFNK